MQDDEIKRLAETIARTISVESKSTDFESLKNSIDSMGRRLAKLESTLSNPTSQIQNPKLNHPSQERFDIAEAIADEVFAKYGKEKACTFEPNDKPCDHCAMCSSRGF